MENNLNTGWWPEPIKFCLRCRMPVEREGYVLCPACTREEIRNQMWLQYYYENQEAIEEFFQPEGETGMETRRSLGI